MRHRKSAHSSGSAVPSAARRPVYLVLCVALIAVTVLLVGRYFASASGPPAPPTALGAIPAAMSGPVENQLPSSTTSTPAAAPAGAAPAPAPVTAPPPGMAPSPPVSVRASDVGINSPIKERVGLNKDNTMEVPTSYTEAAWYRLGPTPGEVGPAVIIGHVDSYKGPGVFFNVGSMKPGQIVDVAREDKSMARFRIDAIKSYSKAEFPTDTVYGQIDYAGLRLITCGGKFDEKTRSYESNVVVFASLIRA